MHSIIFTGDLGQQLKIDVLGYERAPVGEYFDDNWLSVEVSIKAGAFAGTFEASFLTGELEAFREQLMALYETLTGQAEFETLEGQLSLELKGDGLGHINLEGRAQDQAGIGNALSFELTCDQTQLQSSLNDVSRALGVFPVRI